MKFLILTIFCISSFMQVVLAQDANTIKEETKANSKGSFNALTIEMPGTSIKEVAKVWSKYVKKFKGKSKYDKKSNEYFVDDAVLKDMSDNTVDITMKIEERGTDGTALSVWFNLGVSYLSSKDFGDRYPAGEKVLKDFTKELSADMIENELKLAEKQLKELEDQHKKLEKDKSNLEKDVVGYKETIVKMEDSIKKAEEDIKKNVEDQEKSTLSIEEQKKVVEEIKVRLENVKN